MFASLNQQVFGRETGFIPERVTDEPPTLSDPEIVELLGECRDNPALGEQYHVDLRDEILSVLDQGETNSRTAQAVTALIAYFQNRGLGNYRQPSLLFVYRAARNLAFQPADLGVYVRTTLEAMVLFGLPQEVYWPFDAHMIKVEPTAFVYATESPFRLAEYFRYDGVGHEKPAMQHQ